MWLLWLLICSATVDAAGMVAHTVTMHCRRRKKERDCKKKNEKKDFIEWYVVEQTVEYVLTPERIEYIASELVAQYKKDCGIDRIKTYEKQLDRIKAEISRLVDTLAVCPGCRASAYF